MKNKTHRRKTRRYRKNRITKRGGGWEVKGLIGAYRGNNIVKIPDMVKSDIKENHMIDNPLLNIDAHKTDSIVPTEIKSSVNEIQQESIRERPLNKQTTIISLAQDNEIQQQESIRARPLNKQTTRISLPQIKKNSLLHKREAQPHFETFINPDITNFLTKDYLNLNNWKLTGIIKVPPTENNMKIMSVKEDDKVQLTKLLNKEQNYYKKLNELNSKTYYFNFSKVQGQKKKDDLNKEINKIRKHPLFKKYVYLEKDETI